MNFIFILLFLFEGIHKYLKIQYQGVYFWSIFINRILRNSFPKKFYHHCSLANWTAGPESATSYTPPEHAPTSETLKLSTGRFHSE